MSIPEQATSNSQRIALTIEYDGSGFSGWQKQQSPVQETVQQYVETALSKIADHEIQVTCAGRTDAGVHASCQIVHFDCTTDRGNKAWIEGTNSLLPKTIRVTAACVQSDEFHARFSAVSRRYLYFIYQRDIESVLLQGKATHSRRPLNIEAMHQGAQFFLGEHDFSSFRAAGCQSNTAMRNVMHANLYRQGGFLIFDVKANAFLQHMVRNMMGSLLLVGSGEKQPCWIAELLCLKDRALAAPTAAPDGLYLAAVEYPQQFGIGGDLRLPDLLLAR